MSRKSELAGPPAPLVWFKVHYVISNCLRFAAESQRGLNHLIEPSVSRLPAAGPKKGSRVSLSLW